MEKSILFSVKFRRPYYFNRTILYTRAYLKFFFLRPASLRVDSIVILRLNKNIFQENISNILVTTVIFLFWAPISHLTLSWRDLVSFASESKVLEYS